MSLLSVSTAGMGPYPDGLLSRSAGGELPSGFASSSKVAAIGVNLDARADYNSVRVGSMTDGQSLKDGNDKCIKMQARMFDGIKRRVALRHQSLSLASGFATL